MLHFCSTNLNYVLEMNKSACNNFFKPLSPNFVFVKVKERTMTAKTKKTMWPMKLWRLKKMMRLKYELGILVFVS